MKTIEESKELNIHDGHRERLRTRFLADNGESMQPHELLELLLQFVIPRKDTNETAHALLENFGTLGNVMLAPYLDLLQVNGVGESSAFLIKLISALVRRMTLEEQETPKTFDRLQMVADYVKPLFAQINKERLYMLCFNEKKQLLSCEKICDGSAHAVVVNKANMVRQALMRQASWVVLAHNHTNGFAEPSMEDISITQSFCNALESVSISLAEHFIVSGETVLPLIATTDLKPKEPKDQ